MNQDMFGQQNDCKMGDEMEYFDSILKRHSCNEAQSSRLQVDSSLLATGAGISGTTDAMGQIAKHNLYPKPLFEKLCNKNVNLVLVATSLDKSEVVEKLKSTLDPEKSSMIPLNFDNTTNGILGKDSTQGSSQSSAAARDVSGESRKKSKEEKDERYWKRRTSNNEAAKRSRDGRKARFEWIENRIKELEVENALLRQQLDSLTRDVLEKENKEDLEETISESS